MIRSLYSGVSGLKNHQIRMDVVGNNIANVNTNGFKASRVNFQDAISQTMRSASGTPAINPSQIGTGVKVGGISINAGQGPLQNTGRTLDLAIQGNGYFILTDGTNKYYTREGTFFIDINNNLINSDGLQVCDTSGKAITLQTTPVNTISINDQGEIFVNGKTTSEGQVGIATCNNPAGLERVGNNLYKESLASGTPTPGTARAAGSTINSGYLEMSNVDLTEEMTNMITTQRGYQANARVITVSDTLLEELIQLKR
ncbi:flagellar basal-body rod protein FlgF [Desulfotomaculum nigrificans]|uniref:flagellar basal-body rod protein FlgF n=1 Tax=Desulfotomaculum nigrificans TaxID=1565 RepID=UPI0001FAE6F2|nr:flagellar basal-body rod protein FlgF [Desulfotomaculum nigrificans]